MRAEIIKQIDGLEKEFNQALYDASDTQQHSIITQGRVPSTDALYRRRFRIRCSSNVSPKESPTNPSSSPFETRATAQAQT